MNTEYLRWLTVDRESLPEALFGERKLDAAGAMSIMPSELRGGLVSLGYVNGLQKNSYNPPSIVILEDETSAEILSWLRVFAPATAPLSQFGRVVLASDWKRFSVASARNISEIQRGDSWAAVIVGEALAQAEGDVELSGMPLSRASGCFSMAVARSAAIYQGDNNITRTCVSRLRALEEDRRFVRRSIAIDDLLPVWALAGLRFEDTIPPGEVAMLVQDAAFSYFSNSANRTAEKPIELEDFPGLFGDSIEERVIAFQRFASEIKNIGSTSFAKQMAGVMLAAAAFLVGRSTSHAFLLKKSGAFSPISLVWFGLMAGLAGPRSWDEQWSRATKGVERLVKAKFDWTESIGADLFWVEFAWLASTFEGSSVFSALPKMFPKVLSVEVVPGATCQFRLVGVGAAETERRPVVEMSMREKDLQAALSQFINLASRTRQLVEGSSLPIQQSLGLGDDPSYSKTARPKRLRRAGK